jgi:serine/threonine protein kinase
VAERLTPFGKYFLLERINVGGMAEVYKAKTVGVEGFEKIVAIKRILPSVAEDEQFIKMFVDEAKITSQLSHANLAATFDLGKIDDTYYIAMEYVPGKDLRSVFERLKRRGDKMPLPLAAFVMVRVCEGLDYAHRKRDTSGRELHIVHRDVSPQNIILSYEGEVKLIDFGIAKAANKITRTQAGILKGKFGYMSPEQVRGLPLDRRSDIFAAGVVLYELCTGERLFTGSSDFSVLEKVQQARVKPPSQVEASIPPKLEGIILKALAREPEDRYQQAADVAAELTRFLLETQPRPVTRDDLSAFMKAAFAENEGREVEPPPRRPPPRIDGPPRKAPPPLPMTPLEMPEKVPIEDRETEVRPAPAEPPLYDERTEVSADSLPARPGRFIRAAQIAIVGVALSIAAWALLSTPRPGGQEAPATVSRAEQKKVPLAAEASTSSVLVLSSPPGAQVYLDGVKKGMTPAYLTALDPAAPHAISVEKKCYRAWQVAVPPHAGPRELAATLLPAAGACPDSHLEKAGMPAPSGLPEEAKAIATVGFLNLGSRPSAQVQIDGVDIGQATPLVAWPLTSGTHKVRLLGNGGSKEVTVQIRAGESNDSTVDLSPPPAKAVKKRRAHR